jgi:hypothetical protein
MIKINFIRFILSSAFILKSECLLNQTPYTKIKTMDIDMTREEDWDCGEVGWFNNDNNEYIENNYFKNALVLNNDKKMHMTPLNDIIKSDQIIMASKSALIKSSYKELINFDIFLSEFNNVFNSKFSQMMFIPSELLILAILSGLFVLNNKIKEDEINRLKSLYRFDEKTEYFKRYTQLRKTVMMTFIILSCLFTRNVQIVL